MKMAFRKKLAAPIIEQQETANAYFQERTASWKEIYSIDGVQAEIIRDRHSAILDWVKSLYLAPGSPVAEIGCGAGFMSVALAQQGFCAHAIDSVEAMVDLTRNLAAEAAVADRLWCDVGDAYALNFEDASFSLVIAIGVVPWLEQAALAIKEMVRITRPGGYIILTT